MLVSVIMPTYNCGRSITESIDSVLAQSFTDWEMQIVDDCSTDHTDEIIRPYLEKHPNIHYTRLPESRGAAAARTEAIRKAAGKYCAFLDADDLWMPDKLEKQIGFMEKTGALFCCTAYRQMAADGSDLHTLVVPPGRITYGDCLRLSNPIGNLTAVYDQEALGKFEVPLIRRRNDFALWLQILKKTQYCYGMQDVLAVYRTRHSGIASYGKLALAKYHWQLYHEIEGHSVVRSAYELGCWAFVKGTGIGLDKRKS